MFDELYRDLVVEISREAKIPSFTHLVRIAFIRLGQGIVDGSISPVTHHQSVLKLASSLNLHGPDTCLCCLAASPSVALACGHRLCDLCVQLHAPAEGQTVTLPTCVFCGATNNVPLLVKPAAAGARVLSLRGRVEDAGAIADSLRSLRLLLRSSLFLHFDLVVASGVGIFFAIMLFCKHATIEECIHHLPKLQRLKVGRRGGFKFGRGLEFSSAEITTAGTRLVLCRKDV